MRCGFWVTRPQSLNINPKTPKPKYKFKLLGSPGRPESLDLEAFGHPGGPDNFNLGFWGPWGTNTFKSFWPPGCPESLNINLYLSFLVFWRAGKHKFKLLGPPGVARKLKFKLLGPSGGAKTFNSTFSGPPGSPESLNINLYLSFLGFWMARKLKFKLLGPPWGGHKA